MRRCFTGPHVKIRLPRDNNFDPVVAANLPSMNRITFILSFVLIAIGARIAVRQTSN